MRLIDELRAEHALIQEVLGSLRSYVDRRARGEASARDGEGYLKFFRDFSGGHHHGREEDVLFPALVEKAELPAGSGPIRSLLAQHHDMARILDEMAPLLLAGDPGAPGAGTALQELAVRYAEALLAHIDAENSVLLPESEKRLRQAGIAELPERPASGAALVGRAQGERLVRLYPPTYDPGIVRGEGCVICASYGTTCAGVEREWWNESEWEEFSDHLG